MNAFIDVLLFLSAVFAGSIFGVVIYYFLLKGAVENTLKKLFGG